MNGRQVRWLRSVFILVSLGAVSAVVSNCGGDDTGSTPGTGGSAGSSGSAGSGGTSGTDGGGTGGSSGTPDSGPRDSSMGGDARLDAPTADRPSDAPPAPPTDAEIASCNATLADSGVTPCLQACFCNLCPAVGVGCLGLPACLAIARCAIDTQCLVAPSIPAAIAQCTDSETCGPTIAANPTGLTPAVALINAPCTPVCLAQCAAGDASTPPDGTPGTDAEASATTPDATGGDATGGDATGGDVTPGSEAGQDAQTADSAGD